MKKLNLIENKTTEARTERIKCNLKTWHQSVNEIGKDLIGLKEDLEHGMFQTWIKDNFQMSLSNARNFMNVYIAFGDKSATVADLSISAIYELAAPSTPIEVREEVLKKVADGEKVTKNEVKELKAQLKENQAELKDSYQASTDLMNEHEELENKYKALELEKQQVLEVEKIVYPDGFEDAEKCIKFKEGKIAELNQQAKEIQKEIQNKNQAIQQLDLERNQDQQIRKQRASILHFTGSIKKLLSDHMSTRISINNLSKVITPEIANELNDLDKALGSLSSEVYSYIVTKNLKAIETIVIN